jgi:heat shock protein HslJ
MARAALLLVVLLLAGCAAAAGGGSASVDVAGEWELVSGTAAGTPLPRPKSSRATLTFDAGEAGGQSFCNHYFSSYTLDGDSIRFDGIGGTEMGCEPEIMAAESAYVAALGSVTRIARDGDELVLTGDDVELRFSAVPPVPTSELVGTAWVLESLIDGETASSVMGSPATLRLDADGTVSGSTGCRTLTGTWETRGGTVVFPDFAADGECPQHLFAQDDHVVAVLGDGFRADVVENRLTLADPDGRGLVYRDGG